MHRNKPNITYLLTKEVNPRSAKCPLKTIGCLANLGLTSFVKEATGVLSTLAQLIVKQHVYANIDFLSDIRYDYHKCISEW